MTTKKRGKMRIWVLAIIFLLLAIWIVWGNVTVGVTHYNISSVNLPSEFNNYKIAVVSDFHNAKFGDDNSILVKKVKNEKPDIIAITGDLIDSNRTDIDIAIDLVIELLKIAPCYYVTGNHEAWIGTSYQELEEKLIAEGAIVLHDSFTNISKNDAIIRIIGFDDPDFNGRNGMIGVDVLQSKMQSLKRTNEYCVLLSHRPELFSEYLTEKIDLVLSGHAHGGQFRLPFVGGLVAPDQGFFPKYDAGVYSEKETTMIVSRGIGNSIIPIRFNNRPEIVIVELSCD